METSTSSLIEPVDVLHKRWKHAEAQRRYRERNLEATREKARKRMEKLRDERRASKISRFKAARKRRASDADYREILRKRKFIAKFGEDAFFQYYLPQHKALGQDHLPGLTLKYARKLAQEHARDAAAPTPAIPKSRRRSQKIAADA
ncbi:hypothetical protein B0H11DRAFT_2249549 [Mycena galericulata]|nr:hypothetical protein B0H11DRAFT_2249549 [Mycena galericulata]